MIYFKYLFRLICGCGIISVLILLIRLDNSMIKEQQYPTIDNSNVTEILLPPGEEFVAYAGLGIVVTKPTVMKCSGQFIVRDYSKDKIRTFIKIKEQSK